MDKLQVLKTWATNLLGYKKILENGKINIELRKDSFFDWCDILAERGNITETEAVNFKNNITDNELCMY